MVPSAFVAIKLCWAVEVFSSSPHQPPALCDQAVQGAVDGDHCFLAAPLSGDQDLGQGKVPVGQESRAAVLCFPQGRVDSLCRARGFPQFSEAQSMVALQRPSFTWKN